MTVLFYTTSFIVDCLLGDPYSWPHPIKAIGNFIQLLVTFLRKISESEKWLYVAGGILFVLTVGLTGALSAFLLFISAKVAYWLYVIVFIYLGYTTLAMTCLAKEARKIQRTLTTGDLAAARIQVGMIVGRDTENLSREQISKATIETVAENTADGVIAPLFYLFIGGPVLALMYKAVNTLDSMVGYKTEKYRAIGFVSAKMDDIANFIPARLTWLFLVIASFILKYDSRAAWKIGLRDRKKHTSPNCAYPEGAVAGALDITLGGTHEYFGETVVKPTIGDGASPVTQQQISQTIKLLYTASSCAFIIFTTIHLLLF
ncbi:adenosylcobinamide-phosphate synthase CbiB [Listeria ivanovii]|uniref:Cobalamin biosynthesis protein CobD n=1 Tax=Listeria ivanovii (strain ATCC BAA-678 / PAM 55) TaxID=881621 RepID=G2ZEU4_LISIP|nr:adenosylcobinamide-phosphate synthase CbiB [Listeria ivanovii]AHI55669.1 cobalamin biosynthesis protein [Listeria ivanovii WSLC3009]AIS65121.1 cobalamin biosynthesis protein [Listeria ivanovii subsp. ivanovii]MBC1758152.1 cobalamin biosynthesis protein [Listeria ivanovii]MBK3913029.1 cobalamin biosynthesis protein [Listeria ivanovii subsp. ivanovii]MBK3920854.1 cobalamin biosynthesis protein [Listeria ivanovii subsp. ivanovii]